MALLKVLRCLQARQRETVGILVCFFILGPFLAAHGQANHDSQNANNVTVDVGVMLERTHQFVPGLKVLNFKVYEDGVEQKISDFERVGAKYELVYDSTSSRQNGANRILNVELVNDLGKPLVMQDEKHHQLKYEIQVTERYQGSPIPAPAITFNGGSKEGMVGADDLVSAAKNGDLPQVKALLTGGGDVNVRSDGGMTALMHASQYNHVEVVQALLASGADVNAKTSYGNSALTFACAHGFLEIVQTLLANGADVNDPREPPLQAAAGNGHLEVVRALLAKSAEVNAKDSVGTRSRYDSG